MISSACELGHGLTSLVGHTPDVLLQMFLNTASVVASSNVFRSDRVSSFSWLRSANVKLVSSIVISWSSPPLVVLFVLTCETPQFEAFMLACSAFSIGVRFLRAEKALSGVGLEPLLFTSPWRTLLRSSFKPFRCWFEDVSIGDGVRCRGRELVCGVRGWNLWSCNACCVKGGTDWLRWYDGGGIWPEELVAWLHIVSSSGE